MKVGLLADVHGDIVALEAALALLEQQDVDQFVCAGDLVEKGSDGDAVVALMRTREIPCARGNHDVAAESNQRWLRENSRPDSPFLLTNESVQYLTALPPALHFEWEGKTLLVAHGVPGNEQVYLRHMHPPDYYAKYLRDVHADVLVLGHTHSPMVVYRRGMLIVNPGSVGGRNLWGSGTCGVITLPERKCVMFDIVTGERVTDVPFVKIP